MTDPTPITSKGNPERRRAGYMTRHEFAQWRNRAAVLFLLLAFVSSAAAYIAYRAGRDSTNGLRQNSSQAALLTCLAGGELRIAVASGFDQLRRLAVQDATPAQLARFIKATQPAIDELLTQAAGKAYHAPLPPGEVNEAVRAHVRDLSAARCAHRAAQPPFS
jgi:hypothetical protein